MKKKVDNSSVTYAAAVNLELARKIMQIPKKSIAARVGVSYPTVLKAFKTGDVPLHLYIRIARVLRLQLDFDKILSFEEIVEKIK